LTTLADGRVLEVCYQMRGVEMLVIAGMSVLLVAAITAIADATSSAEAAHSPTENMRVRQSPFEVDRRSVPLLDHGRRGGAARTECALNWLPPHRGYHARRAAARTAFTNRVRDTRLEHQQRADQGNFAIDTTLN
jgi:hypothetical protein